MFYLYELVIGKKAFYVGVTASPPARLATHRSFIHPAIDMKILRQFSDPDAALRAEKRLIQKRKPPLNVAGCDRKNIKEIQRLRWKLHVEASRYAWKEWRRKDGDLIRLLRSIHKQKPVFCEKTLETKWVSI